MSPRVLRVVPEPVAEAPDPTAANVDAFDLGRKVGLSEARRDGASFVDGMKIGLSLAFRLASGDVALAAQIGNLLGD